MKLIIVDNVKFIDSNLKSIELNNLYKNIKLLGNNNKEYTIYNISTETKNSVIKFTPYKGTEFYISKVNNLYTRKYSKTLIDENKDEFIIVEYCYNYCEQKKIFYDRRIKLMRCCSFEFEEVKLFIHPYVFGLWLTKYNLHIDNIHEKVKEKINFIGSNSEISKKFWIKNSKICSDSNYLDVFFKKLKEDDMLVIKYLKKYIKNSEFYRKEVFCGIWDGNLGSTKETSYTLDMTMKKEYLLDTISLLARSLGFLVTKCKTELYTVLEDIEEADRSKRRKIINNVYRLYISGDPFGLGVINENKLAIHERKSNKNWLVTGFSIEKIESRLMYKLEVDDDAELLTEDFFIIK
jgi:hypothetical protein